MWNLYKYRVKRLFLDKSLFFWQLIFPIILGTFFWLAFSNITEKTESLERVDVGYVSNGEYVYQEAFDLFISGCSGDDGMLNIKTKDEKEAIELLKKNKIKGIIYVSDEITLKVNETGIDQTVLEAFINEYLKYEHIIISVSIDSPKKAVELMKGIFDSTNETLMKEKNATPGNMDVYVQYYFALFAMVSMFGCSYGILNTKEMSIRDVDVAIRRNVSPTKKWLIVVSDFLAALTIQMTINLIVFIYLNLILGIDFGSHYVLLILCCALSSLVGISYGYMIGLVIRGNSNLKDNIGMVTSLCMSFLSGLMYGNMKFVIEKNIPVINRINPASVISDGFYSLCVFDDIQMYIRSVLIMVVMVALFSVVSVLALKSGRTEVD